jgi:serine/threonine-protein kinase RsbW
MDIGMRVAFPPSSGSEAREMRGAMSDGTTNRRPTAQPAFPEGRGARFLLEMEARISSEFRFIAPEIDRIVRLIEESRCAVGNEDAIELALQEALNNALVHGNGLDPSKQIRIRCRCEQDEGVSLIVTDQGQGFDPNAVPNPLLPERLHLDHGRGLYLMKVLMDGVHFERGGSEVHLRKRPAKDAEGTSQSVILEIRRH